MEKLIIDYIKTFVNIIKIYQSRYINQDINIMPPVIKKSCVNNTEFSYSGKECSPLGKGYAADAEQVGTIMEGRDSTMWMVGIKNGVKVWNRVPTDLANDTAVVGDLQKPSGPSEAKAPTTAAAKKKAAAAAKKAVKKEPVSLVSESEDEPDKSATAPLSDIKEESESSPVVTPAAEPLKEKKKAAATKKKAEATPKKIVLVAEEDVEIADEKSEVKAEAPKKKVTKKKVVTEPEGAEAKAEVAPAVQEKAAASKATRAPTDFNLFMKYQLEVLGKENPEMKHKDKFSKAAAQWKELGEDEKKAILVKAKAAVAA